MLPARATARLLLPDRFHSVAEIIYRRSLQVAYLGRGRECNLCGYKCRQFIPFGVPTKPDVQCPSCRSVKRHRTMWEYIRRETEIFRGGCDVLYFAPMNILESQLDRPTVNLVTTDLEMPGVDTRADITSLPFPDGVFDAIICAHVLEHVPDDRKAMRELYRVLSEDGWLLVDVPLDRGRESTYEDPSVTDPVEREKEYGQRDHVRLYGQDFTDRLEEAGFSVNRYSAASRMPASEMERLGLREQPLYIGTC